jgi:hypothetical protein
MCHSTGEYAQDRAAASIVASYLYYYSRPGIQFMRLAFSSRAALSAEVLFPAQAACLLPGAPNFTSQAHCPRTVFFGVVVSILPLERGIDDRQTSDPQGGVRGQGVCAAFGSG